MLSLAAHALEIDDTGLDESERAATQISGEIPALLERLESPARQSQPLASPQAGTPEEASANILAGAIAAEQAQFDLLLDELGRRLATVVAASRDVQE